VEKTTVSQSPSKQPVSILLVDDNPADVRLARETLKDLGIAIRLDVARDGEEALEILRNAVARIGIPVPDLIFLDLNLPKKNGNEVLAEIKVDPSLRRIPVVVLTTSRAEDDLLRSYDLHANCYVIKPIDIDRYAEVFKSIESFWLGTVLLPNRR
jgi:chemotaxis family two-component system response regulator Rcp1